MRAVPGQALATACLCYTPVALVVVVERRYDDALYRPHCVCIEMDVIKGEEAYTVYQYKFKCITIRH